MIALEVVKIVLIAYIAIVISGGWVIRRGR